MKRAVVFQNQPALELSLGPDRIVISPQHGARLLRWERAGREIIRWPDDADWSQILKVRGGNPVLFPFIARHFVEGRPEVWQDTAGTVRPMPQHGFARDATFAVIDDADAPEEQMRFRLMDTGATRACYPFAFQFDVVMTLLPDSALEIRFETTNHAGDPLPYYAGHHFYLAIPHRERSDWTLDLPCAEWGRQNSAGAILREPASASLLRLDDPSLIDRFQIAPKAGEVSLKNGRTGRNLSFFLDIPGSVPWYAVTTWTQAADSDFYCVEPWLGLPNAIHHGEGLRWLASGASETATCVIKASNW